MRLLKRIGLGLAGLVVLFLGVSLFLPSDWQTERSIEIASENEHILPLVDTPKRWLDWAPWTPARYPGMTVEYSGEERGAGATWSWKGEESGAGSMTITRSDLSYGIDFDLNFEGHEPSKGSIRLLPAGDVTKVTWSMYGDMGSNPVGKYFALLMDRMMQPDFESGLTKLKAAAEDTKAKAEAEAVARAKADAEAEAAARAQAEADADEEVAAE